MGLPVCGHNYSHAKVEMGFKNQWIFMRIPGLGFAVKIGIGTSLWLWLTVSELENHHEINR